MSRLKNYYNNAYYWFEVFIKSSYDVFIYYINLFWKLLKSLSSAVLKKILITGIAYFALFQLFTSNTISLNKNVLKLIVSNGIDWRILVLSLISTVAIDYLIVRVYRNYKHFHRSYKIINNNIIPAMSKNAKDISQFVLDQHNLTDKVLSSPLEYISETLKGNQAPKFKADDSYMNDMFRDEIKYIVAITAEDPNLWLNPTLCFYMTNCYAVSIMKHANKNVGKKMVIRDFQNPNEKKVFNQRKKEILNKLKDNDFHKNGFEFVRFFLYTNKQKESCENTVFPSLKASQDLFNTYSFFIQKDKGHLDNAKDINNYKSCVKSIWTLFNNEDVINKKQYKYRIETRIEDVSPEFLFLFKEDNIVIYTYINGEAYLRTESYSSSKAIKLINYLANYLLEKNKASSTDEVIDDWSLEGGQDRVNNIASYLDWIDNPKTNEEKSNQ